MTNRQERRKAQKKSKKPQKQVMTAALLGLLEHGAAAQESGNLELAEMLYRKILEQKPDSADALHLLGLIHYERADYTQAITLIRQAIAISDQPVFHNNLAPALHGSGELQAAIAAFHSYLDSVPDDVAALNTLGNYYRELGLLKESVEIYQHALQVDPRMGGLHNNIGLAYYGLNDFPQALASLNKALSFNADDVSALNNLALVQIAMGDIDAARVNYKHALKIDPNFVPVEYNYAGLADEDDLDQAELRLQRLLNMDPPLPPQKRIGPLKAMISILGQKEAWAECLDYTQQALELYPKDPEILSIFGSFLLKLNQPNDAMPFFEAALSINRNHIDAYVGMSKAHCDNANYELAVDLADQGLAINPDSTLALINKGASLAFLGHYEEAYAALKKCIDLAPGLMDAHFNISFIHLALGRIKEGFAEYSVRYHAPLFKTRKRHFPQPTWKGEDLKGKRIVVWAEQGLGDEILFANPIPDLMKAGGDIHIECDGRLTALYERSFPGATLYPRAYAAAEEGEDHFDYQVSFPDLCTVYRNTLESFAAQSGYLKPDPKQVELWKGRLSAISDRPKIGISWRSGMLSKQRSRHYATIEELAPIFTIDGVDFVNLQYGDCTDSIQVAKDAYAIDLHTWDDLDLKDDQDDLAALISSLDLVIAPSNSVAALAGALGQKTFEFMAEERMWPMLGTDHLPWYPSVQLFSSAHLEGSWEKTFTGMARTIRETLAIKND